MKQSIFSILDRKLQAFYTPQFQPNDAVAIRALSDVLANDGRIFSSHPEDFELWCLGVFDDDMINGGVVGNRHLVCQLTDLVPNKKEDK